MEIKEIYENIGGTTVIELYKYKEKEMDEILKSIGILVDSREKANSHIIEWLELKKIPYQVGGLPFGDYSFYIPANESLGIPRDLHFHKEIVIERKGSLEELSGNFSKERDRIEKEISLYKGKMIMLIEDADYCDIVEGKYTTKYAPKSFLATLHSFSNRYDVELMFMSDNKYSGLYMLNTFYYYLRNIIK